MKALSFSRTKQDELSAESVRKDGRVSDGEDRRTRNGCCGNAPEIKESTLLLDRYAKLAPSSCNCASENYSGQAHNG